MKVGHYTAIFQKEPEGGYTVIIPSLKGCVTYGKTLDEAKKMAGDAIRAYLGSLAKDKVKAPSDIDFISTIDLVNYA